MADLGGDDMCRCGAICDCGGDDWGEEYYDAEYDGCASCGAEIDHYLGCPGDPDPDYAQEAGMAERQAAETSLTEIGWENLGHGNAPVGEL